MRLRIGPVRAVHDRVNANDPDHRVDCPRVVRGCFVVDVLIDRPEVAAAGIPPLKEETSRSYTLGLTWTPRDNLSLTLDGYRIDDPFNNHPLFKTASTSRTASC